MLITFTLVCTGRTGGGSHPEVEVKTLTFAPDETGAWEWTTPVDGLRIDDKRLWPNPPADWLDLGTSAAARWRRRYRCPHPDCSVVVVARDETFRPVVEKLLAHGVSRLTLVGLAGTLTSQ